MANQASGPVAVIVGGGIGGLSAAIALQRTGWDVTVLEQAPEFAEVGAGLTLMANALRGLEALGVHEPVRAGGHPQSPGGTMTSDGRWLARIDADAMMRQLGTSSLGIHRATLHRILRDALPPQCLVTDATVVDVAAGPPAEVHYRLHDEPASLRADLVVGADGVDSVLRSRLWPDSPPPVYAGSTAWRGVTCEPWDGPVPVTISWGRGAEFGTVPLGDGCVYWYGAVNAPAGEECPDEFEAVRRTFGSWHDPIPALIDATEPKSVLRTDIFHLGTPLPTYVRGRVVLLGDAAHAMTPNLGQGACQAIEDAVVLGSVCCDFSDPDAALASYDAQRRPRTQQVARAAHLIGRLGQQLHNPVAVAVRNTLMRLTPAPVALSTMSRYADWYPPGQRRP